MIPKLKTQEYIDCDELSEFLTDHGISDNEMDDFYSTFEWGSGDSDYWGYYSKDKYEKYYPKITSLISDNIKLDEFYIKSIW